MKYQIISVHSFFRLFLFLVLSIVEVCYANKPPDITPSEMALLPPYCRDTQSFGYGDAYHNTSPNAAKWVAIMGKDFWHMHHHCWALINFRRAERATLSASEKLRLRKEALSDFWYVAKNASHDFVLLPEIYTWIGRTELLLRNPRAAAEAFSRARSLKPNYIPPYIFWADFLVSQGQRAEAMKVVIEGLRHSPDSKALIELYYELGGKLENLPKREPSADKPLPSDPSSVSAYDTTERISVRDKTNQQVPQD
jgi:tetratricopeptide (TPR) repeat protein